MEDNTERKGLGITRRLMLKATAATTGGAALFAGSVSATDIAQVNFCGCSQLCIVAAGDSRYRVWVGYLTESDEWDVKKILNDDTTVESNEEGFCYTTDQAMDELGLDSDSEPKLIAVEEPDVGGRFIGNPGRCAQNVFEDVEFGQEVNSEAGRSFPGFINSSDSTAENLAFGGPYGSSPPIEVIRGRCGDPGKDAPPRRRSRR